MVELRSTNYELRNTSSFLTLPSSFLTHRVTPDECGLTSSDEDPGTNGATSKTRCGTGNQHYEARFASGICPSKRDPRDSAFHDLVRELIVRGTVFREVPFQKAACLLDRFK